MKNRYLTLVADQQIESHPDNANSTVPQTSPAQLPNRSKAPSEMFSPSYKCIFVFCAVFFAGNFFNAWFPAHYLTREWITQIEDRCRNRPDLCISVVSVPHSMGWFWRGRAFHFKVPAGKTKALKAHIVHDMPDSKWSRWFSPWNFVGASFQEQPPPSP